MKYYIATAIERAEDHRALAKALDARGWSCAYDWTAHGSVQGQGAVRMSEVAAAELRGVTTANVVIVLLPGGRGTHCELGAALAARVPVVLVGRATDLFDASGRECAFYSHPGVIARLSIGASGFADEIARCIDFHAPRLTLPLRKSRESAVL